MSLQISKSRFSHATLSQAMTVIVADELLNHTCCSYCTSLLTSRTCKGVIWLAGDIFSYLAHTIFLLFWSVVSCDPLSKPRKLPERPGLQYRAIGLLVFGLSARKLGNHLRTLDHCGSVIMSVEPESSGI
jgi:hypothetical protein